MASTGEAEAQPKVHPTDVESGGEADTGVCDHKHYSHRAPWLRALVLGANDGLVSVASLMLGVGAVEHSVKTMAVGGLAGLVAGACSMAIGEFVSVYSQRDAEKADVEKERQVGISSHCHGLFPVPAYSSPGADNISASLFAPLVTTDRTNSNLDYF